MMRARPTSHILADPQSLDSNTLPLLMSLCTICMQHVVRMQRLNSRGAQLVCQGYAANAVDCAYLTNQTAASDINLALWDREPMSISANLVHFISMAAYCYTDNLVTHFTLITHRMMLKQFAVFGIHLWTACIRLTIHPVLSQQYSM